MRIKVRDRTVTTVVTLDILDGPVIRCEEDQHRVRSRSYRPTQAVIRWHDGRLADLEISGPIKLATGGYSALMRDKDRWYGSVANAPDWVRKMLRAAEAGATEWTLGTFEEAAPIG